MGHARSQMRAQTMTPKTPHPAKLATFYFGATRADGLHGLPHLQLQFDRKCERTVA